jgi:preprotein translocase subunit SecY
MKMAITAVVISAFIFGGMYVALSGTADSIADYISKSG